MTELKKITEENFIDAFDLMLAPGQEKFMSHPIRSLAQAYVYRDQCQPFGIYAGEKMIGYVMVIYDYDIPEYDIWHMMIDESMQGRGYGRDALDRVIEYIRTKPFGNSDRVALMCNKNNLHARKLYESKGFSATGVEDEDEIELVLNLKNHNEDGIYNCTIEHIGRYGEIYAAAFSGEPWNDPWNTEDAVTHVKELLESKQSYGLEYRKDGKVVGFILGTSMMFHYGRTFEINDLAVDPAYQKQGIAKKLMDRMLSDLCGMGYAGVHLITSAEGILPGFYAKYGFTKETEIILMGKSLEQDL